MRSGKLRGLAVTGATRSEVLPDLPTVADFLPGYEATSWYGLGAPKGTPAEIIEKLNREVNAILAEPKTKARFLELGAIAAARHAGGIRQAGRGRDREVGQGGQVRRRQGDVRRRRSV